MKFNRTAVGCFDDEGAEHLLIKTGSGHYLELFFNPFENEWSVGWVSREKLVRATRPNPKLKIDDMHRPRRRMIHSFLTRTLNKK